MIYIYIYIINPYIYIIHFIPTQHLVGGGPTKCVPPPNTSLSLATFQLLTRSPGLQTSQCHSRQIVARVCFYFQCCKLHQNSSYAIYNVSDKKTGACCRILVFNWPSIGVGGALNNPTLGGMRQHRGIWEGLPGRPEGKGATFFWMLCLFKLFLEISLKGPLPGLPWWLRW